MPVDYTYLTAQLVAACENDSTEFADYLPNMVNMAEERLTNDLDDYGLVTEVSVAIPASTAYVTLPSGTRIVKNLSYYSSGSRINLLLRTDEYLNEYWPVSASTAAPVYYGKTDNTTIRLAPTPVSAYDAKIMVVKKPDALTSVSTTNYFTDFCYPALFNACMVEAMIFQKNFSAVGVFDSRYGTAIEMLRNQARRTRRDDMEAPNSTAGADTNLLPNTN
jgi:hypothetical protein